MSHYLKRVLFMAYAVASIMAAAQLMASEQPSVRRKLDFLPEDEEPTGLSARLAACSLAKEAPAVSTPKKAPAVSPFFAGTRYEEAAKRKQLKKDMARYKKLEEEQLARDSEPLSESD